VSWTGAVERAEKGIAMNQSLNQLLHVTVTASRLTAGLALVLATGCVASSDAAPSAEPGAEPATAQARRDDGPRCRPLRVIIRDASAPDGCTSPNKFCAAGTVEGNLGFHGTTYFVLDGAVLPPATAPGFLMTTGLLVYTVPSGTLTVRETGVGNFAGDPSNGTGTSIEQVISGTGRYAGATGTFYNNATEVNGQFTSLIHGQLCVPRGQGDDGDD
jgi:hypothetical protein